MYLNCVTAWFLYFMYLNEYMTELMSPKKIVKKAPILPMTLLVYRAEVEVLYYHVDDRTHENETGVGYYIDQQIRAEKR